MPDDWQVEAFSQIFPLFGKLYVVVFSTFVPPDLKISF